MKVGAKRREAALAKPTLLPGVCPRSGLVGFDAQARERLRGESDRTKFLICIVLRNCRGNGAPRINRTGTKIGVDNAQLTENAGDKNYRNYKVRFFSANFLPKKRKPGVWGFPALWTTLVVSLVIQPLL